MQTTSKPTYCKKLYDDMLNKKPTAIYTMADEVFEEYGQLLQFAYLLKNNSKVHNLVIYFINHHALPKEFGANDTYIKVFDAKNDIENFASFKAEWESLDCPPLQIMFSLDEENTQRVEFTDNKVFNCIDPADKLYYYGFSFITIFNKNVAELNNTLWNDVINKVLLEPIEEGNDLNNGKVYYA